MTCNSFCSISLDPLTVMVSLAKNTRTPHRLCVGRVVEAKADESHRLLIFFQTRYVSLESCRDPLF